MKIAFLAGYNSIHTVRWVNEMALREHEVHLITMHLGNELLDDRVKIHYLPIKPPYGYYMNTICLRTLLNRIQPNILHTHYASGYGTLGRLSGLHPNLLSVWGSDVFDFPYQSKFKERLVIKNLQAADRIASTSHIMKKQIEKLCKLNRDIAITPFGINCDQFKPEKKFKNNNKIIIGTVKKLAPKYGISTLIKSFKLLKEKTNKDIELIIVGDGPQKSELKRLAKSIGVGEFVFFTGALPHNEIPSVLNSFDIYCALSLLDSESFGVAIAEASACGLPTLVSDVGGLPGVVVNGKTGFIVERNNPKRAVEKLEILVNDTNLRKKMGAAGRQFVLDNYEWKESANRMEILYKEVLKDYLQ